MRFYGRKEIAEITDISPKSNNFRRDVENVLAKWCYGYEWIPYKGVTITYVPTTPEERLQEILIRQFHIDIQVNVYAFACFVTAFTDIEGFISMPWKTREPLFREYLGRQVNERTLRRWMSNLLKSGIVSKGEDGSYWKTEIKGTMKIRSTVSEKEVEDYYKRRSELVQNLEEQTIEFLKFNHGLTYQEAKKEAWKDIYYTLWAEFGCCYYYCKSFHFTAWSAQGDLAEVYELTREISGKEGKHA